MTTVYVVTVGEYSDQYTAGVFSTEEGARQYCKTHARINGYEDVEYQAVQLDKGIWLNDLRIDEKIYRIDFNCKGVYMESYSFAEVCSLEQLGRVTKEFDDYIVYVKAITKPWAHKKAADLLAAFRATEIA